MFDNCEAQAKTSVAASRIAFNIVKFVKNIRHMIGRYADAGILYCDSQSVGFVLAGNSYLTVVGIANSI